MMVVRSSGIDRVFLTWNIASEQELLFEGDKGGCFLPDRYQIALMAIIKFQENVWKCWIVYK
jgi:hypothetical protein